MQQNVDMDGAAAWLVVQDVFRRLVDRGLMNWEEVKVLIASAEENARWKTWTEQKTKWLRPR